MCALLAALLAPVFTDPPDDQGDDHDDDDDDGSGAACDRLHPFVRVTGQIAQQCEADSPHDAARGVVGEELEVAHACGTGQGGHDGSEECHETTEEEFISAGRPRSCARRRPIGESCSASVIPTCGHRTAAGGPEPMFDVPPQRYSRQCNGKYTWTMGEVSERWLVLVVRVPAEPSRHRVGVWRELRRVGAVPLGQGSWVVPDVPAVTDAVARACELAVRGEGEILVLVAEGRAEFDVARLHSLFTDQRQEEWFELLADCAKFDAEIDKEIRINKLTFAELEEEEQSLERLRRWYKAIKVRDVFGAPAAAAAEQQLKHCAQRLEEYTQLVFATQHQN